ncbi:unnamed protein product, partial [Didymodactylos carnosus]
SIQYVARHYKIPQISYGATSTIFTSDQSEQYPYFVRTIPDLNSELHALARFIANQSWHRIALLYGTDRPNFYNVLKFGNSTREFGVEIVVQRAFVSGESNVDLRYQFDLIRNSSVRVIVFIGTIKDQQEVIRNCLLHARDLFSRGYQWIGVHNSMFQELYRNNSNDKIILEYHNWTEGFLGLQNFADENSEMYRQYKNRFWHSVSNDSDTLTINPTYRDSSVPLIANFAYDACFMFAHALHIMIEELGQDPTLEKHREKYMEVLKKVTFQGVTGNVSVNEDGDRSAPFDILNFVNGSLVKIGSITAE